MGQAVSSASSGLNSGRLSLCADTNKLLDRTGTTRQYLYVDQLAELTPWTPDAIRTMIARGVFKLGVHYFKPSGPNSRPIFSWAAIVDFIENEQQAPPAGEKIPLVGGVVVDLHEAAEKTGRVHG